MVKHITILPHARFWSCSDLCGILQKLQPEQSFLLLRSLRGLTQVSVICRITAAMSPATFASPTCNTEELETFPTNFQEMKTGILLPLFDVAGEISPWSGHCTGFPIRGASILESDAVGLRCLSAARIALLRFLLNFHPLHPPVLETKLLRLS